jgi:hypothetical protein
MTAQVFDRPASDEVADGESRRHHVHVYAVIRIKVAVNAQDHRSAMPAADELLFGNGLALRLMPTAQAVLDVEYRPEDFTQQIQFDGPPLPCHKTIPGDGTDARAMCAEALIFMRNSCKAAHHPDYGDALETVEPDTDTVFAWSRKFLDHHSDPAGWIERVRARMMERP